MNRRKTTLSDLCTTLYSNYYNLMEPFELIHIERYPKTGDQISRMIAIDVLKKLKAHTEVLSTHKAMIDELFEN